MSKKKYYRPIELAKALGISKQTLLRYEKKKLFPRPRRNVLNNWRVYSSEDLESLRRILEGKSK